MTRQTGRSTTERDQRDDRDDHEMRGAANYVALLIGVLGIIGFAALTVIVDAHVNLPFDQSILAIARSWDGTPAIWNALSESANFPLIGIGFGLIAYLFVKKRRREALLVLIMLAAVTAGSEGVKQLVARPRPGGTDPNIPGVVYSYPSGHVLEVLVILGMVAIRTWRSARPTWLKVGFAVLVAIEVVLVGIARMALNEHFPSDVLAGILGGLGALGLYAWLTRSGAWAVRSSAKNDDPRADPSWSPGVTPSATDPR